ncbi:hypothetical protein [Mycobacterium haemophilum]
MRCILSSPADADLTAIHVTLDARGIDTVSSLELGAGAALADADLNGFDFAVAVLPRERDKLATGISAIFVEIGILIGRQLPLLVIVAPPGPPPPALMTLNYAYTDLDNLEALNFHVDLFLKKIPHPQPSVAPTFVQPKIPPVDIERFRTYFAELQDHKQADRGLRFEQAVVDLLRECGAIVEERSDVDDPVDIAAYIPGYEKSLGTFVVQVKAGRLGADQYWSIGGQLGEYVITSRSGLGVLISEHVTRQARDVGTMPLVILLDVQQLLSLLQNSSLGRVLLDARNSAIHGI